MMVKFNRNYKITIDNKPKDINNTSSAQDSDFSDEDLIIEPPFTIQFDIHRTAYASLNYMTLAIYNLSKTVRGQIFQDRFYSPQRRGIKVEAGYGNELSTVFIGDIFEAGSSRQGTNIITLINARDGVFDVNGTRSSKTLEAGSSFQDIIRSLIGDFPNLNEGVVSPEDGTLKRPVVLSDVTFDLIKKYAGINNQVFIDLEKVNVMKPNEVITGNITVFDDSTGLLETPRRDNNYLSITTLFEPRILINQVVELKSSVQPEYNGVYKIIGLSHQGIISEAVGGKCQSVFNLLLDGTLFGEFKTVDTNTNTPA